MKKSLFLFYFFLLIAESPAGAQTAEKINWRSFEQSLEENGLRAANGRMPKKIFVDVYTDWCGWCKRLDATTFAHPEIIRYMNENFIPVKLDAERTDTVVINGQLFVNRGSAGRRGSHDLAIQLLQGKMSYPSCTFLDETGRQITIVPGYMDAGQFEILLHFVAEDAYKTLDWETFANGYSERAKVR